MPIGLCFISSSTTTDSAMNIELERCLATLLLEPGQTGCLVIQELGNCGSMLSLASFHSLIELRKSRITTQSGQSGGGLDARLELRAYNDAISKS